MGKRKRPSSSDATSGRSRVEVIMEDLSSHPRCLHGPTLLFSGDRGQFYACASCRDRECSVRITKEDWEDPRVREKNKKFEELSPRLDKEKTWKHLEKVSRGDMGYCSTCDNLYTMQQESHHTQHCTVSPLSKDQLTRASTWLPPLENDTREAQYLFSEDAVQTILNLVRRNEIRNVICIGTPSIHEAANRCGDISSILLDLDSRHHRFWSPQHFLWYNMFNHHFLNGSDDEAIFHEFLKCSSKFGLCIILDPPFGGRVEPIVYTLDAISTQYHRLQTAASSVVPVPVIWAFPYFSEPYIKNLLPDLQMHDYQVTYTNHGKFKRKPHKPGSPVRLFTNLPLHTLDLSHNEDYKLCRPCSMWVSVSNRHCAECNACTSKNGSTYKHCDACKRCVKSTFFHCEACKRCCQVTGHVCGVTVQVQSCYNCNEKGHRRIDCPLLESNKSHNKDYRKNKQRKNLQK